MSLQEEDGRTDRPVRGVERMIMLGSDGVRSDNVKSDDTRSDGMRSDGVRSDGEGVMV